MYRICANERPYRAERASHFVPAGLSACPGYSSTRMEIEFRFPCIGSSDGQSRLAGGRLRAQRPGVRSAPSHIPKPRFCPIFGAEETIPRSARGRTQIQMLRATNEQHCVSADSFSDNNLGSGRWIQRRNAKGGIAAQVFVHIGP